MADPTTWIAAPARQPRPNTSLDVIPVHDVSSTHFTGFQYQVDPCSFPGGVAADCYIQIGDAPGTAKDFSDPATDMVTEVFGLYAGIECFLNGGMDEFRSAAQRVLVNGEYHGVDAVLAGLLTAGSTSVGTGTTIVSVIGALEDTLANNVPGQGYLYMNPALATLAISENLVYRNMDGTLETYLGTKIVVLSGLTGSAVVYASGPINLFRSSIEAAEAPAWTVNKGRALAERLYSLGIECGMWHDTLSGTFQQPVPSTGTLQKLTLGTVPASPIAVGTDVTAEVHATVAPTSEVYLWYAVNGGTPVNLGEMTEIATLAFVYNLAGGSLGLSPGDSVEAWAVTSYGGGDVESNHIVIEVTA